MLLRAYAFGVFPMAESRDDPDLHWIDPKKRGIIPLEGFHIPRRLARTLKQNLFEIRCDRNFAATVEACAAPAEGRMESWINPEIFRLMTALHERGFAHSVECWQEEELVGGLYGVALGGAFFGESMFSRARDASKVALAHLVMRMKVGGFRLLDTQFVTPHLARFGAIEVTRADYQKRLAEAIAAPARFYPLLPEALVGSLIQSMTQTS